MSLIGGVLASTLPRAICRQNPSKPSFGRLPLEIARRFPHPGEFRQDVVAPPSALMGEGTR